MMDDEEMLEMQLQALEAEATQFDTYEDYLDSQIQKIDLFYLCQTAGAPGSAHSAGCREDEDMARQLVELVSAHKGRAPRSLPVCRASGVPARRP